MKQPTQPGPPPPLQDAVPPGASAALRHQGPFLGLPSHYAFDPNLYPLTNPPLYDPTMLPLGPQGGPRRRRISISNGQIGQIVNHEAFYLDDDSLDEYYDSAGGRPPAHAHAHAPLPHDDDAPLAPRPASHDHAVGGPLPLLQPAMLVLGPGSHAAPAPSSVAGVPPPNQTLVYNNEVIFNPHDGPIPGTAAWKKERLLERNRLAASKCRQRKKNAQQQLQSNMAKFERELQDKTERLGRAEKLLATYNAALQQHFAGDPSALDGLRPYVAQPPDNIKFER
ncbi:hypothetical protein METBIDRAFT_78107 [Metschnikowia bicuspidata var. bicuspidata NRRL YB-4993]|uniref:BZIP domain-containing protein n=1 Tax=Metschnikowia bicuspidata var. bicuspidata NRRL YB-4993 TaxID=869754 RepID=A0A1A0HAH3_9ASCO|nr:hypothetical protein METBIDRAFT_78107 [Metschnikowia bicuspidata var. bicuspidata NRRL YB-4993]OBA21011.1 hypothetical protein METBIDRAFT_78107 [Metschnikowia bicuspidata var. bicuspidata NRRL YB-4993]